MEHLLYCLHEIELIHQFLKLRNSSFYSRAIARFIAVRTDDFIKLGFQVNNQTLNSQIVRDDLNTLRSLYNEYFKKQRDKYGAHFQDLDLLDRLQSWQSINLEKADFFGTIPVHIYNLFSAAGIFVPFHPHSIHIADKTAIEHTNEEYNIEKHPNFSSDILALTRPNSGGIIHGADIQNKAGALKSLELLIDYELALVASVHHSPNLKNIFIKTFITDLVSYCDNLYSRTDLIPGAVQDEPGLDHSVTKEEFPEGYELLTQFKHNFKFNEHLTYLRQIRNKTCGHIDTSIPVAGLKSLIENFNIEKYKDFYSHLKTVFQNLCYADIRFRTFLLGPEPVRGISRMSALDITTFDGSEPQVHELESLDVNDEDQYHTQWSNWLGNRDVEAQSFFWSAFADAEVVEEINWQIKESENLIRTQKVSLTKAHLFFQRKLLDDTINAGEKKSVIDLFIRSAGGYPHTLSYLLHLTFEKSSIKADYIYALGFLQGKRSQQTFDLLENYLLQNDNLYTRHQVLLTLFRIDLAARHLGIRIDNNDTLYSSFIKEKIIAEKDLFRKILFVTALGTELHFGKANLANKLRDLYLNFFEITFQKAVKIYIERSLKSNKHRQCIIKIYDFSSKARYTTALTLIGDLLRKNKHKAEAKSFYGIVAEGFITVPAQDDTEWYNYAVANYWLEKYPEALDVARQIHKRNPADPAKSILLLQVYLQDKKHEKEFNSLKSNLLHNYNLTEKFRQTIHSLNYKS